MPQALVQWSQSGSSYRSDVGGHVADGQTRPGRCANHDHRSCASAANRFANAAAPDASRLTLCSW